MPLLHGCLRMRNNGGAESFPASILIRTGAPPGDAAVPAGADSFTLQELSALF